MLHNLPAEIALDAVSYLPLQDLYSTILVSRDWNTLLTVNEHAVYRNAALLHQFVELDQLHTDESTQIDWKTYCRRQLQVERGWCGKTPCVVRELSATGSAVHRIKVDHEQGFVITTCQAGGLFVCDIQDNRVLWSLPSFHTVRYAHCEYDRGFIVFNRNDNCKEVWRQATDVNDDELPQISLPDTQMHDAFQHSARIYRSTGNNRGHFKPWALLHMPEITRAFRYSYPTLLATGSNVAYLWDVPKGEMVSAIQDIQRMHKGTRLGIILYVEVNDTYAFICGSGGLRIFAREDGALLYHLSTTELALSSWSVSSQARCVPGSILQPMVVSRDPSSPYSNGGQFMACHVSASGDDLVALTTIGRLVIIPSFRRLFSGSRPAHHKDIALILNFQPLAIDAEISYYLAIGDRNDKCAIATRKGIFVVSTNFEFSRLTADRPPHPGVTVCRLSKFLEELSLSFISCLQLTYSGIYFNYKPGQRDPRSPREGTLGVQSPMPVPAPEPAPALFPVPVQPAAAHNAHHNAAANGAADGAQVGLLGLLAHLNQPLEDFLDPWVDEEEEEEAFEFEDWEDNVVEEDDFDDDVEPMLVEVGASTVYAVTF